MTAFLLWFLIGVFICVVIYGLPIAIAGLVYGIDPASPLAIPPCPPTRKQLEEMRRAAERRARYFEDTQ